MALAKAGQVTEPSTTLPPPGQPKFLSPWTKAGRPHGHRLPARPGGGGVGAAESAGAVSAPTAPLSPLAPPGSPGGALGGLSRLGGRFRCPAPGGSSRARGAPSSRRHPGNQAPASGPLPPLPAGDLYPTCTPLGRNESGARSLPFWGKNKTGGEASRPLCKPLQTPSYFRCSSPWLVRSASAPAPLPFPAPSLSAPSPSRLERGRGRRSPPAQKPG